MNEQLNSQETEAPALEPIFKLIVVEQATERVWYEAPGAASATEAVALYRAGEALETGCKHLSTDHVEIDDIYQESDAWYSREALEQLGSSFLEVRRITTPAQPQTLSQFADRIAYLVTDLNGLIGSIVNQEVTISDFNDNLTEMFAKLAQVEGAVSELTGLFWQ